VRVTALRQLAEIRHAEGLEDAGGVMERLAVRAIVARGRQLLLLSLPRNLDDKFPGGGVEPGDPAAALRREVLEECGAQVTSIGEPYGEAVEYMRALRPGEGALAGAGDDGAPAHRTRAATLTAVAEGVRPPASVAAACDWLAGRWPTARPGGDWPARPGGRAADRR
jgi:8-oxo-dGTP pyrophosphatase MutT (NUDIX family)